jgi:2',3'-cyclic-nucleotide 2'-phosphodiesterase (5'-nucleotidase family)
LVFKARRRENIMQILRRNDAMRWLLTVFLVLSVSISTCYAEATDTITVTFYHTSDIHENSANFPHVAPFIRDKKEKNSNVLFLDSGDWLNKGDLTPLNTRGEAIAAMMQASMYDAVIPGNHDFTVGIKRLLELLDKYSLPLLSANCVWAKNMIPKNLPPYRIYALDGVTVAIIGTAGEPYGDLEGLLQVRYMSNEIVESIRSLVSELDEKADIIVLMTHLGVPTDRELARALPRIDLIAGGHHHRIFKTLVFDEESQTVIQHSGCCGEYVGEIVLKWDGEKIVDRKVQVIKITPEMPKSNELEAMRKKYMSTLPGYWECLQRGDSYSTCAPRAIRRMLRGKRQ